MENEDGLELSLGLSLGGGSVKSKGKITSSSGANPEESDRGNKLVDDFKNFLHGDNQRQESDTGSFQSNSIPSKDNFFNDLSKVGVDGDSSIDLKRKGTWIESNYVEAEDENLPEIGNKRKLLFMEMNSQKKQEKESHHVDLHEKGRASYISSTEDGSTAEKGDVVESRAEDSTSRLSSKHDDSSKQCVGETTLPKGSKDLCGFSDSGAVDLSRQKRFNSSSVGVSNSVQAMNMHNAPFPLSVKDTNTLGAPSTSGHLQIGMQHVRPTVNGDRSGAEHVNPRNLPLMAGISPLQISAMDKDKSWGLVSHPQMVHHPHGGGGASTSSAPARVIGHFSSDGLLYGGRVTEHTKGDSKQPVVEEGSSSRAEQAKGSSPNMNAKDILERSKAAGVSLDFPAIKPGIAADIEFGGCGSYPNLPWVSTTAPGPAGKTISGVTYRYNANQIKIVCACHGTHLSPEEFIRHASNENFSAQNDNGPATIPNKNPAASAQS
ncbi:ninja-family protein mc410 [Benincasa hispida]|uniref:ninja-family protein mc410 n=1 Tax=Benincasa hispida TaxID=102211 RepID=UPI001902B9FE|nr:ninja-family protein mc410 [Benincasa hispida]XP_038890400.1 ninja-family protein mc410 [Benincasa hispida]